LVAHILKRQTGDSSQSSTKTMANQKDLRHEGRINAKEWYPVNNSAQVFHHLHNTSNAYPQVTKKVSGHGMRCITSWAMDRYSACTPAWTLQSTQPGVTV
jgi:hypothetical protein